MPIRKIKYKLIQISLEVMKFILSLIYVSNTSN